MSTTSTDPEPIQPNADNGAIQPFSNPAIPPPSAINNAAIEQSNNHHSHARTILLTGSLLILIAATFILSVFFFRNERQPQTSSRASSPKLTPTIPTITPSSSSFGSLLQTSASDSAAGKPSDSGTDNPPARIATDDVAGEPVSSNPDLQKASFSLVLENNSFTPKEITVYKNQIITIDLFAKDKTYDVAVEGLGLYVLIPASMHKSMDFQALNSGTFTFFCGENCQNDPNAKGTLIIK